MNVSPIFLGFVLLLSLYKSTVQDHGTLISILYSDSFIILTSPIIIAFSGGIESKAEVKNVLFGFPTNSAVHCAAYSNPLTKQPGPNARPSFLL